MEFEWDPAKSDANFLKHGLDFPAAKELFSAPFLENASSHIGEERKVAIGPIGEGIFAIVFTMRNGKIRIISARRARKHERQAYLAASGRQDRLETDQRA